MHTIRKTLALLLLAGSTQAVNAAETRSIMHEVFQSIAYLLPRSLVEKPFDGDDSELIQRRLRVLEESSSALAEHAGADDAEFGLLARSFSRSTRDIGIAFGSGDAAFAYYALMDMTEHCAACHSRLPDAGNFHFGQRLMARMDVDAMPPGDLAQLYVATRQFDTALDLLERTLMDPSQPAVDLDRAGTLVDYLRVAIAVQQQSEQPAAVLARFAEREDLPWYLKRRVGIWQGALAELPSALEATPTLAGGRALFQRATAVTTPPQGREGVVHDLAAASVLRQWLEGADEAAAPERSEALYLLGLIALRTRQFESPVPEMELLFEAAIRAAPDSPQAAAAYALLEEFGFLNDWRLIEEAGGRGVVDLPALKALIGAE
jgi:hypothetical protein